MGSAPNPRIALITGGVGDIGLACARKMIAMGMDIAMLDIVEARNTEARLRPLRTSGRKVIYLQCDVTNRASVEAALDRAWAQLPNPDVCMCNAGIVIDLPFLDFTPEQWQKHIDVNLTGYFHVCQAVGRRWVSSKHRGKFIFTGSWVQDVPYKLIAPYCVSKAGVWMLARCVAVELAPHGITTNVVAPGIVNGGLTAHELQEHPEFREEFEKLIPLGRMQTTEDVAEVVWFLVSSASDYLTGTSVACDGGCIVGSASVVK
jgi:NAD(P)-dependent dehydrogenase (short-subunit alcohol dehydrogenase family)